MELIKRYLYAIERRLPRGSEDIIREIESIIMDELEGKYGTRTEYTKEEIETVIKGMGPPRLVAQRYRGGSDTIIGPELSYIYRMVLGIVTAATVFGLAISFVVGRFTAVETVGESILSLAGFLGSAFTACLTAVGSVTIIFMLIERFGDKDKLNKEIGSDWDPKELAEMPEEKDKVTVIGPIITILFALIWAVFINTYARMGSGVFPVYSGAVTFVMPVFDMDVVRTILPLWNLGIAVTVVTQLILLKQGRWTVSSRIADVVGQLVSIVTFILLLNLTPLFDIPSINSIADFNIVAGQFDYWYYISLKILLVLTIIGTLTNTVKAVMTGMRKANLG
ncbi:MAG: hypothetical protein AB1Z19_08530 [Eubacteriales bacterium]